MPPSQADTAQSSSHETVGFPVDETAITALASRTTAYASGLWVVAIVSLFADGALTVYGVRLGLAEANPVAADVIASVGLIPALALLKGGAVGVAVGGWIVIPDEYRGLVPAGLALPWTLAAGINLIVIGLTVLA